MAASVMTYDTLLQDLETYTDRHDDPFIAQLPRFVMMAENRISSEIRNLGLQRVATGEMTVGQPVLEKPTRWRETISFNYGAGATHTTRTVIYERTYEWCRTFWPNPDVLGAPRYYCDYDYNHFLIAATPDYAYPFELVYHERPEPLSDANQTNWTTEFAPQLLLYAALLETAPWLKADERMQVWQGMYDRVGQSITKEDNQRAVDRSSVRK